MNREISHDFDSVKTYMEPLLVFGLMVSGTYLYTLREEFPWIPPFVVLTYGIIISFIAGYQYYEHVRVFHKEDDLPKKRLKTIGAGFIWVLWLVYGIIFSSIGPIMKESVTVYFQGGLVITIILITYWNKTITENFFWANSICFVIILLLFIPHVDTISHDLNKYVLFAKIFTFYLLYALTEACHVLREEEEYEKIENNGIPQKYKAISRLEIKIVQSSWVLLASKYLIVGAVLQVILLFFEILKKVSKKNEEKTRNSRAILDNNVYQKKQKKPRLIPRLSETKLPVTRTGSPKTIRSSSKTQKKLNDIKGSPSKKKETILSIPPLNISLDKLEKLIK